MSIEHLTCEHLCHPVSFQPHHTSMRPFFLMKGTMITRTTTYHDTHNFDPTSSSSTENILFPGKKRKKKKGKYVF